MMAANNHISNNPHPAGSQAEHVPIPIRKSTKEDLETAAVILVGLAMKKYKSFPLNINGHAVTFESYTDMMRKLFILGTEPEREKYALDNRFKLATVRGASAQILHLFGDAQAVKEPFDTVSRQLLAWETP